ncbi:PTS mannitol transporter subunit IICBA [Pleomorphomonas diazotrophica]|uniref:PTS system mannitol-specific EIICBA component n=1 Tax=Pleomorphomonas diazotrophica TaxID=1166257 RepID=A0A1I4TBH4_9HYPH|nr:PTS mannitol transporter subunit IICBA [Pleomorphomonas diazotrophica]PKR89434.1 PTS mannitol transporter subunit IICBA [Pleomorphomonas diazotrophica]SFM74074.1 PTS system D-mannitol-specific IIA component, Fru family /PTS system D-mannitol-specific IIB component, Fru family /PTS system D-mannitol-specific IIC component, Fru family [Pleomorphomonas diazotrophica]
MAYTGTAGGDGSASNLKVRVQQVGRFLSSMVMPNIGAFVAWGIITTLFIPTGWLPNEYFGQLVGPMIKYLLPLLLGYTGGKLVYGERGAVVGAIVTAGAIIGAEIPMFLGAMIVGPIGGWAIKQFDKLVDGKIRPGFEMLVNNFSSGIIGMILAMIAYAIVGPIVASLSNVLGAAVNTLIQTGVIPLASVLVEPAKVLFLNNAINHGVFTPLGIQQAAEQGKSLVFLIEANPGPGLGLLLAYMVFGRGNAKESAPAAAIIHFFGGIHEIYFPYVLMKPRLIIAMIAGGATGVAANMLLGGGLRAPASPGSIFAVLGMTPADGFVGVISSVVLAAAVTFLVASVLLKTDKTEEAAEDLEAAAARMRAMKAESKGMAAPASAASAAISGPVRSIMVACDAGMGSSAMGASMLRKKLDQAGLGAIRSGNVAINALPSDVDVVITHKDLTERARRAAPGATHVSISNFLDGAAYDRIVAEIKAKAGSAAAPAAGQPEGGASFNLGEENIFLGLTASTKEEAIRFAGSKLLEMGAITPSYIDAMLQRETIVSTYLGQSLAMPHGTNEAKNEVLKTGIVVCQYPDGVFFGPEPENVARLVVGLAAKGNEHMDVMSALARVLENPKVVAHLATTKNPADVLRILDLG